MDNELMIDVKGVSKSYKLYDHPIDRLKETFNPWGKQYHRNFFALKDISFKVNRGDTIGILGRNGAGKSTLLKIITGVLTPSSGSVTVNGKIASLLELGAGFNPDFTGIENIYLNGTVMGYTKDEMDMRLSRILEFADIGEFVNQPVKTYSSGMYVRLAFSVAINVEPDILIVDEALAVGDAKFQRKCFARLEDLKAKGMTILFVTHDLATTKQICSKAILIDSGRIISIGEPKNVVMEYYDLLFPKVKESDIEKCYQMQPAQVTPDAERSAIIVKPDCTVANTFGMGGADVDQIRIHGLQNLIAFGGEKVNVEVYFRYDENFVRTISLQEQVHDNLIIGVSVADVKGTYIFGMTTYDKGILLESGYSETSRGKVIFSFTMPFLDNGDYVFNTAIALGTQENHVQLKWYDGLSSFKMQSAKRYIYGMTYQEYDAKLEEPTV